MLGDGQVDAKVPTSLRPPVARPQIPGSWWTKLIWTNGVSAVGFIGGGRLVTLDYWVRGGGELAVLHLCSCQVVVAQGVGQEYRTGGETGLRQTSNKKCLEIWRMDRSCQEQKEGGWPVPRSLRGAACWHLLWESRLCCLKSSTCGSLG